MSWTIFMFLGWAGDTAAAGHKQWRGKVKGWFRAADLRQVMLEIIQDPRPHWLGRTSAVRACVKLGARKKVLLRLRKKLRAKASEGDNNDVLRELDRALSKMK